MSKLVVMSARAVKAAVSRIATAFAAASGCTVEFDFEPVGAVEAKLAAGAQADVIILSSAAMERMAGSLVPGSRRALGRTSIGIAVRAGAPSPAIASAETFRQTLLAARALAVSDPAAGGTAAKHLAQMFERMGLTAAIGPKLLRCANGGDVGRAVAAGEAEIGMTFVSEMLPIAGVHVVGPLPDPLGSDTVYEAAVMQAGINSPAGLELIQALTQQANSNIWKEAGFEPETGL
jgi:molybdate transport system substrate-binding protein